MQNVSVNMVSPYTAGKVVFKKRSGFWSLGQYVVTLNDNGFLNINCGYIFHRPQSYYLKGASFQDVHTFLGRTSGTLVLRKNDKENQYIRLPLLHVADLPNKIDESINKSSRESEVEHFNNETLAHRPYWLVFVALIIALLIAFISVGNNHGSTETVTNKHTLVETSVAAGQTAEEDAASISEQVITAVKSIDYASIWEQILPYTGVASDIMLIISFLLIAICVLGAFLPRKALRFISVIAALGSLALAGIMAYQKLDVGGNNSLLTVLYAIIPALLALLTAVFFLLVASRFYTYYKFGNRVGIVLAYVLSLLALGIFAYGHLHTKGYELPVWYPSKIVEFGNEAYAYIAAAVLVIMLILCACLGEGFFSGTLSTILALVMIGHIVCCHLSGIAFKESLWSFIVPTVCIAIPGAIGCFRAVNDY